MQGRREWGEEWILLHGEVDQSQVVQYFPLEGSEIGGTF